MDTNENHAQTLAHTEINWETIDKVKFYGVGAGLFSGVTVALYPVSVVKTRLQVTSKGAVEQSAISVFGNILRSEGIRGLYRGFGTMATGGIPSRIIFMSTMETTKLFVLKSVEPLKLSEASRVAIANGVAGLVGSVSAQAVFVPIDVISQTLMVQGYSGHKTYNGGLDILRKIIKADGIRGLYRGFGLSMMTYAPTSAVWWASYGSSQRQFWRLLSSENEDKGEVMSTWTIVGVQAAGGVIAGATACCVTTPLDTIKTRLQVIGHEKKHGAIQVVKDLVS